MLAQQSLNQQPYNNKGQCIAPIEESQQAGNDEARITPTPAAAAISFATGTQNALQINFRSFKRRIKTSEANKNLLQDPLLNVAVGFTEKLIDMLIDGYKLSVLATSEAQQMKEQRVGGIHEKLDRVEIYSDTTKTKTVENRKIQQSNFMFPRFSNKKLFNLECTNQRTKQGYSGLIQRVEQRNFNGNNFKRWNAIIWVTSSKIRLTGTLSRLEISGDYMNNPAALLEALELLHIQRSFNVLVNRNYRQCRRFCSLIVDPWAEKQITEQTRQRMRNRSVRTSKKDSTSLMDRFLLEAGGRMRKKKRHLPQGQQQISALEGKKMMYFSSQSQMKEDRMKQALKEQKIHGTVSGEDTAKDMDNSKIVGQNWMTFS
ncbi:MAG: hypothetical protein EZS28_019621 [Streblomastix strix]|uniref:Uncharacterized protein n=1 Tax=Streblomastix strix TaxID=222440 RepID=A0A5J4VQS1_9EUKA|nr:MAG: hypothetical protein EZS28_019621 [Streblomastix strix]